MFFATISYGLKSGTRCGLIFSFAHMCVEFALVMLLALGLITVTDIPLLKTSIGIIGGLILVIFGVMQLRSLFHVQSQEITASNVGTRHLFITGSILTALNPYFIVWWLTVGANLILLGLEFASFAGVMFMYLCHVWIDYLWHTLVAYLAKMGTNIIGGNSYRGIIGISSGVLIFFGLLFLSDSA